ncbi:UbiH/UbiF family hydroxylase [Pseudohoeflea sp. DP4N28-3]|uniref:UbiH/UbiF family hydroxylase n=2 Tax=Pseudohoeflea coraliihabitans TaxID=2860393 RepID=A0ABS6WR13_9HYPH|nr:UbiH/UbiF family hydroxylase [Pseudohoeflea sp. DP4N28-3]
METPENFDVAVVGGGLAGSLAALAAARQGWRTAFLAPAAASDRRTTALLSGSVAMLRKYGLWETVAPEAAALSTMRIIDGTTRLFRAPPVTFRASEIDLETFGYNIPNAALLGAATDRVAGCDAIVRIPHVLAGAQTDEDGVTLTLSDGSQVRADAVLAADGRNSVARQAAGIATRNWSYPQSAIVLNFQHRLPHHNISTEFHRDTGPFTQVPLPGNRSSLVWTMRPDDVDAVMALPADALNLRVETLMASLLGAVEVEEGMQSFPMAGLIAENFARGRTFLIGESGHAFPPIGAQGLNLGLRDIEQAIERLADAGGPAEAPAAALSYDRARRIDVRSRTFGVDLLNRTLLNDFLPVQMLRAGGLAALSALQPLKILAMREGLTPRRQRPPLGRWLRQSLREKVGRQRS